MAKILIMVRTSTEKQSIDDQHIEMLEFCKGEGYAENDMVWIEEQGASAAKVDNTYREMIDRIKSAIESDKEIDCFAVWHLNRLVRTEEVWVEIKSFFVERRIQIVCKNPYLRLLAPDGSVDKGMELAAGLLVILAKQDQEERKAKFKRARTSMLKKGQYIGGKTIKYGYKVENKTFVEDEVEGAIVKAIFDMYSTGKHSSYTLAKELQEQGIDIPEFKVCNILRCRAYLGEEVSESGMHYPQIISQELFDRCEEIRQSNKIMMKRGEKLCLGSKIIKCPVCGATCTSNSKHYRCSKNAHHGNCENKFALNQKVADELLWRTAFPLHLDYLMDSNEGKKETYRKEIEVLDKKIETAQKKMEEFTNKKDRIVDSYLEGLIDRNKRDLRLSKLEEEVRLHRDYLSSIEGRKRAITGLLETSSTDTYESFVNSLETIDYENKFDVVHKWIESLVAVRENFGKKDRRSAKPNGVHIFITSIYGKTWEYFYIPRLYEGSNLFVWNGSEWIKDYTKC